MLAQLQKTVQVGSFNGNSKSVCNIVKTNDGKLPANKSKIVNIATTLQMRKDFMD